MSDRLGAALKQAGKAKVRRRRKRSDAGKKRGPKVKVEPVVQEEDEVVLVDSAPIVDQPRMSLHAVDRPTLLTGLGMSEGTFSFIFPECGDYFDSDDVAYVGAKLGLSDGVLEEAIGIDMPVFIEATILPIHVPNQRLVWARSDDGECGLVKRRVDSCRPGQRVLIKDQIVVRVLR